MKKILSVLLSLLMIFSMVACTSQEISTDNNTPVDEKTENVENTNKVKGYTPGVYNSTVRGHQGDITVSVTTSEDSITDIKVDKQQESVGIGSIALERLPKLIVEKQSLGIDAITGATISSRALIQAVSDCVEQANGDLEELKKVDPKDELVAGDTIELETDVLVIGGGGSGLSTSIEAARAGSKVIILEKLDYLGGDTGRAGGGAEAAGTTFQEANGIYDKPEDFSAFIRSRGVSFRNPELLDTMVNESADAIYFLADMGADMSVQVAGHGSPVARAHRPAQGPAGQNIVVPMINEIEKLGVDVYYGTPGYELITKDGAVVGAKARNTRSGQEYVINAKAVVIATGNFASNNDMVAQYDPRLKGIGTNSSKGSEGDGIVMATAVGAELENMEIMRVRPTLPTNVNNYIAISQDSIRFMDEYHSDDTIFVEGDDLHIKAIENREEKHYWIIIGEKAYDEQADKLASYMLPSNYFKADTLSELASMTNLDKEKIEATVTEWNEMVSKGEDSLFGRTNGMEEPIEGPFYAIKVLPTAHTTAGGIRINTKGEVLNIDEMPIPGLFAGGEVTGGVHDGVSAVCGAIVYGRISGISAAEYAQK